MGVGLLPAPCSLGRAEPGLPACVPRFANSLPINDPLQTVYQLMSGRMPAASTVSGGGPAAGPRPARRVAICGHGASAPRVRLASAFPAQCCGDEKWGDWRPHLAMVLSNLNNNVDVESRTMATMGDTLGEARPGGGRAGARGHEAVPSVWRGPGQPR